jgi:uncharacterized protein YciI
MKRSLSAFFLGVCLVLGAGRAAQVAETPQEAAKKPDEKTAGPQRYQLVLFKLGPAWQKGVPLIQQPGIQDHANYMRKLAKEGTLVLGGPLIDDQAQVFTGAMMILAAASPEEAKRLLEIDPAQKSEVLQIEKIETMIITGASWRPAVK